jgi:hypothetical protein
LAQYGKISVSLGILRDIAQSCSSKQQSMSDMKKLLTLFFLIAVLCGCATTSNTSMTSADGPVKASDGQYKLGGLGNANEPSGTAVKVRFMQQATAFCSGRGLAMAPGKSKTKDASADARASAEIQFRCVTK